MFNIKSDCIYNADSSFKKCKVAIKECVKAFLGYKGTEAHIYEFPYTLERRDWEKLPGGNPYTKIMSRNDDVYFDLAKEAANNIDKFYAIQRSRPDSFRAPYWNNDSFPPLDSLILYSLIKKHNPSVYMEVGSGNSTKFVRRAIEDNNIQTKIISIEPFNIPQLHEICDEVERSTLETTPIEKFRALNSGDVLFIDNSHRSFQGSDVTCFFTEILPCLKSGVIYGLHDIFLPGDYPGLWKMKFYNEQYLLMAYLLGGAAGDQILFPAAYMSSVHRIDDIIVEEKTTPPWGEQFLHGGAFWMIKS